MRARPLVLSFVLSIGAVASVTRAYASPAYPGVIQSQLATARAPECTICHATPSGGLGTATTGFATYLRSRGLGANDQGSLRTALEAMIGERHDTDGDGVTDLDALKAGQDPNGMTDTSVAPPKYGCGAHVASRTERGGAASGALVAVALALVTASRMFAAGRGAAQRPSTRRPRS